MAIIGSLQNGLKGDTTILFAKSTLDGIIAIILTANLGIGVALSAVSVLLYQGTLTLLAGVLEPVLTTSILNEVTATGGMLIMAIGVNMLKWCRFVFLICCRQCFGPGSSLQFQVFYKGRRKNNGTDQSNFGQ